MRIRRKLIPPLPTSLKKPLLKQISGFAKTPEQTASSKFSGVQEL